MNQERFQDSAKKKKKYSIGPPEGNWDSLPQDPLRKALENLLQNWPPEQ